MTDMRILIDLQGAQNNSRHRGIGRYSLALAKAMARNAGAHRVFILLNGLFADTIDEIRDAFADLLPADRFLVFHAPGPVSELNTDNDWRRLSAEVLREHVIESLAPDALLVTSLVEGAEDDTIASLGRIPSSVPVATVLYDLIPLTDPARYIGWEPARIWYMGKIDSMRRADQLFAISQSAAEEAISLIDAEPERVKNILSAADGSFSSAHVSPQHAHAVAERLGIHRKYLMHSSAFEARKNFQGLIKAFAAMPASVRSQFQLVLVCKLNPAGRKELEDLGRQVGLAADDLVLTGFVSDDDLVALYSDCHLFVFPSFHEGFGLPALEAMCCGAPTIGSRLTSIPEVIGRSDALFDPGSTASMSDLMLKALTDQGFYESLKEHAKVQSKKFSWDITAQRAIEGLEDMVARHGRSHAPGSTSAETKRQNLLESIAELTFRMAVSDRELLDLARCIESNDRAVAAMRATAVFGGELIWRIEGPFDSTYSLALLNRETARALSALGHTVVLHSTEGPGDFPANPQFLADNPDLAAMHQRVAQYPQETVDVTSRNLYPPRVQDMRSKLNLLHHYAWEESAFPPEWVQNYNTHLSALTCLSDHVEKVMIDSGVRIAMLTSGCGVDHWERILATPGYRSEGKGFKFLHVSSCFPRKGIDALLEAYGRAFTSADDVSLIVKTFPNPHNEIHALLADCRSRMANYPDVVVMEGDLSESDLKALYQHCQALVAPSRAEGFGLPMAEAMLSGLPVVTTRWGGQLDFCTDDTAWLVDFTFKRAATHFDLFASVWADPDIDSLAAALTSVRQAPFARRQAKAEAGRQLLLESFKWSDVAARLVTAAQAWSSNTAEVAEPRIGWISTWNTKCGIAAYSEHILRHFPSSVTVLAPHEDGKIRKDGEECVRAWRADKDENDFGELCDKIDELGLDTLVLQFNYGFYNFRELRKFIERQVDMGRVVMAVLHSTGDPDLPPAWNWSLSEVIPGLARCHRVLVHSPNDLNRMKQLGLTDNVMLFPLGVLEREPATMPARVASAPVVAAYGYCLPHKGLLELVEAVDLLRKKGTPVRLRLVNAQYPAPVSTQLVAQLRDVVRKLSLGDWVEAHHEYLEDEECLGLLQSADLVVFPYQETNESASAAVRFGIASHRPVGVTPLRIFDDLGNAVFRFDGTAPQAIADGISSALKAIATDSDEAKAVAAAAVRWRAAHSYRALASRLHNVAVALARQSSTRNHVFDGSSHRLKTQTGRIQGRSLVSDGTEGFLFFGPYLALPAGRFQVKVLGQYKLRPGTKAVLDVTTNAGKNSLAKMTLRGQATGVIANATVHLPMSCKDLEVRFAVESQSECRIDRLEIIPLRGALRHSSMRSPASEVKPKVPA